MKHNKLSKKIEFLRDLVKKGNLTKAAYSCDQLLSNFPDNVELIFLRGQINAIQGDLDSALTYYNKALKTNKTNPTYLFYRAKCFHAQKSYNKALEDFKLALVYAPNNFKLRMATGAAASDAANYQLALDNYIEASRIQSDNAIVFAKIAVIFDLLGQFIDANEYFQKAIDIDPKNVDIMTSYGIFLSDHNNSGMAIQYLKRILELQPDHVHAHNNLGNVLTDLRYIRAACASYENALKNGPLFKDAHSNLLLTMHYDTIYSAEDVFQKHLQWERTQASGIKSTKIQEFNNDTTSVRKLRVGYLSADFRIHSVSYFLYPILLEHEKGQFDIYCYSNVIRPDDMTKKIESIASISWRDIQKLDDAEVVSIIKKDKIDILIELSGHTANNRLKVLACKPAPIQVSYLGYPDTTGLSTIDYRLTDKWADPPGVTEYLHSETLIRIPEGFLAYKPPKATPEIAEPPVFSNDYITFGSFNKFTKITESVVAAWAEILKMVPGSKLLIKSKNLNGIAEERLLQDFQKNGIEKERIERKTWISSLEEHFELYNDIDIALDTFPYNGTTTTFEALWMGKPVVTLTGYTHVTRVGCSILSRIGLDELITYSPQEYIKKCVDLAYDLPKIKDITSTMRKRLFASGVLDSKQFTKNLESCFFDMWESWKIQKELSGQTAATQTIKIFSGLRIIVPKSIHNPSYYSLLEYEDIGSEEPKFFRNLLKNGGQFVNVGCNSGAFILTCAKLMGNKGKVLAIEKLRQKTRFIEISKKINFIDNCQILTANLSSKSGNELNCITNTLDQILDENNKAKIDYLYLNMCNSCMKILQGANNTLQSSTPLLLFKRPKNLDDFKQILAYLSELHYSFYQYLPGPQILGTLVPQSLGDIPEFIFACKADTAESLSKDNLLASFLAELQIPPVRKLKLLENLKEKYAFGKHWYDKWVEAPDLEGTEAYLTSLNLYELGRSTKETKANLAYFCTVKAYTLLCQTCDEHATLCRFLSLSRLAFDAGHKEHSIKLLKDLLEVITTDASEIDLTSEPFLVPNPRFDRISFGQFEGDWLLAAILEQLEVVTYSSSYNGDNNDLIRLEMLDSTGFSCNAMERRRQLLRTKLGLQKQLIPSISLNRPAKDNLNYELWS